MYIAFGSSSHPFDGPWQVFIDSLRSIDLVTGFVSIVLILFLWLNPGMRKNRAWLNTSICLILGDYFVMYTEWARIGYSVNSPVPGRLWISTTFLFWELVAIRWYYKIRDTPEKTMYEKFWRTRQREKGE